MTTGSDLLEAARKLAPDVASRSVEIEQARRLPADLAAEMASAHLFGVCVPQQYGGVEGTAEQMVDLIETLAVADGSVGWCLMIGATTGLLGASLPDDWAREIYGSNPHVLTVGVTAPNGRATPCDGGHRVTGRWPFASGCQNADWIVGGTILGEGLDGVPDMRLAFFSPDQLTIHDTWHVTGLCGTGSHDIEASDAHVPDGRMVVLGGRTLVRGPLYEFPTLGLLALGVSAVSVGIARRALDELVALAAGKVPTGSARALANRPAVQAHVARAEAAVRGARAFVREAIGAAWRVAERGDRLGERERADLRLAAAHATWQSVEAVDRVYHAAGGTSVYTSSALQRCFRDIHVTTQHLMVAEPIFEVVGRMRLGLEVRKGQL